MGPDQHPDFSALMGEMQSGTFGHLSAADLIRAHPELVQEMSSFDPIKTAGTFGGLLLEPRLQANCLRLEALVHLALFVCKGKRKPGRKQIQRWFRILGSGRCGMLEDPAEDVFVSNIETSRGNFKIVEGLAESAGFYLQRFVNLLEEMPDKRPFSILREGIFSLLTLSDLICQRAGLIRYQLGEEIKQETVPLEIAENASRYRALIRFTQEDLALLGVDVSVLQACSFLYDHDDQRGAFPLGHTPLERHPIVVHADDVHLILPTSVSNAIRRMIVDFFGTLKDGREALVRNLALEYERCLAETTFLKGGPKQPVRFSRTKNGAIAALLLEVDEGRFISFVFFMDTLEQFDDLGLLGTNPDPEQIVYDLDYCIDDLLKAARARPNFLECLTIVVSCGVGRGLNMTLSGKRRENWRLLSLSAADFWTLAWVDRFENLTFWRVLDAEQRLKELDVELHNFNGFLNLVAWARMLNGHLVPHGDIPSDFGEGHAFVVIEQNRLRLLRHEVATSFDPHVVPYVDGSFKSVCKINESIFEEDRALPLYASLKFVEGKGLSTVYLAQGRVWWAELETDKLAKGVSLYDRWQILTTWLPRIAPVLEREFDQFLPTGVLWSVAFFDAAGDLPPTTERASYDEALEAISFEIDRANATVRVRTSEAFERAIFNEANIAERALVYRTVEAFAHLSDRILSGADIDQLVDKIVPSNKARQTHRFRAREFRDFVHEQLSSPPVLIDDFDDATPRLGLGWRSRDRSLGDEISGKSECTEYLNALVTSVEDEVCSEVRSFNRQALIEFALLQHERAVLDRDRWRGTSGAVLALRKDQQAAAEKIADHEFKLNAVFQATRLLVEIAVCECPVEGGRELGDLDFCRLMSKILIASHFGGCSDAIRWDAMEPRLRITPLGDVHLNYDYFDNVLVPFGKAGVSDTVASAIENYGKQLEEDEARDEISSAFPSDFVSAWHEEFGFDLEAQRPVIDCLENLGITESKALLAMRRSELIEVVQAQTELNMEKAAIILDGWTLSPRAGWKHIPEGYKDADRQPWRFGRRLSVLRRPIIQIDKESDPILILASGLLRDSFSYVVGNYYRGAFPQWQITSRGMKKWTGTIFDEDGRKFSAKVADKVRAHGWKAETEVKVTKLLRKGFERDFGDVDVVAWEPSSGKVVLMECKDLKYKKTTGEIAEQISDFRGEFDSRGKPDLLRKHLDRVALIQQHEAELAQFVDMHRIVQIEHMLVFRNPVPMRYAWGALGARTQLHTYADLDSVFARQQ